MEANGNITSMPGVGTLAYENSAKPYQVTMLTPTGTAVPLREQNVTYTSYQRPNTISEDVITASFAYNSAGDRVKMDVKQGTTALLTRYYIGGQYELDTQTNTERLYLGGDAYSAPAIYVKEGTTSGKVYYICRDYLGSITHIANSDGSLKQELSYDAWGRLRNPSTQVAYTSGSEPELLIGRGYTGHEHLPWFGLVNMNARLYDPLLGRFLSPDPYVQAPNFTQNFNRYSYCLNNPLVYVDETGEFIHLIIGAAIGGVVNVIANWKTIKERGFWTGVGYFGVGAAAGALSAGIGAGISSALVSGGSFSAGFLGTAAAKTAVTSFISGAAIGGGAGGTGGFITGFGNGLLGGKNFGQSLGQGALYGLGGAVSGALVGGVIGGIDAYRDGRNFMHGGRLIEDVSMPLPQMNQQIGQVENLDCRYEVFRSNDTYYNGNTNSVSDLRNRFPNVETSDATMSKMYGSKRMSLLKLDTSGLSKVEIANEVAANLAKNNSVIYEMRINEKFAHAVAVSRVRIYDNGRILLNFMNPSGAGGYRTNNFNNLRQMFRVLKF